MSRATNIRLYSYKNRSSIDALVGKRICHVGGVCEGSEIVEFYCDDGTVFGMFHEQDCCETVELQEFDGDPSRTIGLVTAARVESSDREALSKNDESHTWTFYVIDTEGGTLHLRWYGTSNGYYSEDVNICSRSISG